jgi:hypothetical protein
MIQEIIFRFSPSLLGSYDQPNPPIADNAAVIFLERGQALVGVWDSATCGFSHPANQRELAADALKAILASYPDIDLTSAELRFFTCPDSLLNRFDWQWGNSQNQTNQPPTTGI